MSMSNKTWTQRKQMIRKETKPHYRVLLMSGCVCRTWSLHLLSCCCISVITILSVSSWSLGKALSCNQRTDQWVLTSAEFLHMTHTQPHLADTLAHGGDELLSDHVHKLQTRTLQRRYLLLHYGFEGHVRSEQTRPARQNIRTENHKGSESTSWLIWARVCTGHRGCFWWRSWSPVSAAAHQTRSEHKQEETSQITPHSSILRCHSRRKTDMEIPQWSCSTLSKSIMCWTCYYSLIYPYVTALQYSSLTMTLLLFFKQDSANKIK